MKILHLFTSLTALLACISVSAQSLAGDWQGRLQVQQASLRIVCHFTQESGAYSGTMDSPDQGAHGLPMGDVALRDGQLTFTVPQAGIRYTGTLVGDTLLNGTFMQGATSLPLDMKKTDLQVKRPQTPRPPFPYSCEEVTIANAKAGVSLAGTLTLPAGKKPCRAVILLTGSGTQDRDETLMDHKLFWVIADHLTRQGIAVLRCDDRGAGSSTGDPAQATTRTSADDAACMLDYLRQRPEIDPARIGLLGHSEGGAIAFLTAAERPDVDFVVSLAGPGVRGDSVMLKQNLDMARLEGMPEAKVESLARMLNQLYALSKSDLTGAEVIEQAAQLYEQETGIRTTNLIEQQQQRQQLRQQMAVFASPWLRCFLQHDPQKDLAALRCHVMALNGDRDTQVDAAMNLGGIRNALTELPGRQVSLKRYPGLNHLFQHCQTGLFTEYAQIEETISPEVLTDISTWVNKLP